MLLFWPLAPAQPANFPTNNFFENTHFIVFVWSQYVGVNIQVTLKLCTIYNNFAKDVLKLSAHSVLPVLR